MKRLVVGLLAMLVSYSCSAASILIDGTTGQDVSFASFSPVIPFSMLSLSGAPADFTISFNGYITADARYCLRFPPGMEPPDCHAAIDPISMNQSYTATSALTRESFVLPFGLSSGENGVMHFSATSGGSVFLDIAGAQAVPEPASWALMIGGFGLAGAVLRRRSYGLPAGVSFGLTQGSRAI